MGKQLKKIAKYSMTAVLATSALVPSAVAFAADEKPVAKDVTHIVVENENGLVNLNLEDYGTALALGIMKDTDVKYVVADNGEIFSLEDYGTALALNDNAKEKALEVLAKDSLQQDVKVKEGTISEDGKAVTDETPSTKEDLTKAIEDAKEVAADEKLAADKKEALDAAIEAAKEVAEKEDATAEEITAAVKALNKAVAEATKGEGPAEAVAVESVKAINDTSIEVTFGEDAEVTAEDLADATIILTADETTLTATYAEGSLANGKAVFNLAEGEKLVDATVYALASEALSFEVAELTAKVANAYAATFATESTAVTASTEDEVTNDDTERTLKITAKDQYGEDFSIATATNLSVDGSTLNGMPLTSDEIEIENDTVTITRTLEEGDELVIKVSSKNGDTVLGTSDIEFTVAEAAAQVPTSVAGVKATVNSEVPTTIVAGDTVVLTPDVRDQNNTPVNNANVRYVVTAGKDLLASTGELNSTTNGGTVDKSNSGTATFTVEKPGKVTIDVFNVKNGAKYTYTVEVGAKKLTTITSPASITTGVYNNEEIKTGKITATDGAAFTPELIKFHVTDANGNVTTDATVEAKVADKASTTPLLAKGDIYLSVKTTKAGTYKVVPYVGESFTAEGVVKGGQVTVTTTLNPTAASITTSELSTLKVDSPSKVEVAIFNKHGEDITKEVLAAKAIVYTAYKGGVESNKVALPTSKNSSSLTLNPETKKYEAELTATEAGDYTVRISVGGTAVVKDIEVTAEETELASINLGQDVYDGVISGDLKVYQIVTAKDSKGDTILPDGISDWNLTVKKGNEAATPVVVNDGVSFKYVKKDAEGKWTTETVNQVTKANATAVALEIDTTKTNIATLAADTTYTYTVSTTVDEKTITDSVNVKIKAVRALKEFQVTPESATVAVNGVQKLTIKPVDQYGKFIKTEDIAISSNDINTVSQLIASGSNGQLPTSSTAGTTVLAIDKNGKVTTADNEKVAYVAFVEAKKAGSVILTVKSGNVTKEVPVTTAAASSLVDTIKIAGEKVDENGNYKYVMGSDGKEFDDSGETAQLSVKAFNGSSEVAVNQSQVVWTQLTGQNVATVSSSGKVTMTAVPTEDTTIKVQASLFGKTAIIEIPVVKDYANTAKLVPSTLALKQAGSVTDLAKIDADPEKDGIQLLIDGKTEDGESSKAFALTFTGLNGFGDEEGFDGTIQSYDTAVATVSNTNPGEEAGKFDGTFTIAAAGTGKTQVGITLTDGSIYTVDVEVTKEIGEALNTTAVNSALNTVTTAVADGIVDALVALADVSSAFDVNSIVDDNAAAYVAEISSLTTPTAAEIQTAVEKVNAAVNAASKVKAANGNTVANYDAAVAANAALEAAGAKQDLSSVTTLLVGTKDELTKVITSAESAYNSINTVKLTADINLGSDSLSVKRNITINGNGKTLSSTNEYGIFVQSGADLVVTGLKLNVAKATGTNAATGIAVEDGKVDVSESTITVANNSTSGKASYGIFLATTTTGKIGTGVTINATPAADTSKGYVVGATDVTAVTSSTFATVTTTNEYSLRIQADASGNKEEVFTKADAIKADSKVQHFVTETWADLDRPTP